MDSSKIITFSLVQDKSTREFYAFMEERMFYSLRWFYFMDETGNHYFCPEVRMYNFLSLGKARCTDANSIIILIKTCNEMPQLANDFLNAFRRAVSHE